MPDKQGNVKIDHYNHLLKQGIKVKIPDYEIPQVFSHCLQWWSDLNDERPTGFGHEPLQTHFILRFLNIYGIIPLDIELKATRLIDSAYIEVINGRSQTTN